MSNWKHKISRFFISIALGIRPINGIYFILTIGFLAIFIIPALFTIKTFLPSFKETGQIGDTINGIAGPFIALTAAILTYLAFYMQYKANRIQIRQFKEQKKQFEKQLTEEKSQFEKQLTEEKSRFSIQLDIQAKTEKKARFENKYFELVRFHRANMEEMNIGDKVFARKCFIRMYYEFKFCFDTSFEYCNQLPDSIAKDLIDLTAFSYKIFFFGIGELSESQYNFNESEKALFKLVKVVLKKIQSQYEEKITTKDRSYPYDLAELIGNKPMNFEGYYYPFDGHVSRLAHYYRHLFHTVKFVVKQDEKLILYDEKLDYLQTIRAQLSNHEQVMLYYNAISGLGEAWFKNEYFTKYKMIHNLSFALTNFGLKPHEHPEIQKGIKFWEEKGGQLFEQDED